MKARLRKRECCIFCLRHGLQVRPSPASSVIFLFLVTAACLVCGLYLGMILGPRALQRS